MPLGTDEPGLQEWEAATRAPLQHRNSCVPHPILQFMQGDGKKLSHSNNWRKHYILVSAADHKAACSSQGIHHSRGGGGCRERPSEKDTFLQLRGASWPQDLHLHGCPVGSSSSRTLGQGNLLRQGVLPARVLPHCAPSLTLVTIRPRNDHLGQQIQHLSPPSGLLVAHR